MHKLNEVRQSVLNDLLEDSYSFSDRHKNGREQVAPLRLHKISEAITGTDGVPHKTLLGKAKAALSRADVTAFNTFVSAHAALMTGPISFASSKLYSKYEIMQELYLSLETLIGLVFVYISWHTSIAVHELGHYLSAGRLSALNDDIQLKYAEYAKLSFFGRALHIIRAFLQIPWGKFPGVDKTDGRFMFANFISKNPFNLAVSAAGPRASKMLMLATLPVSLVIGGLSIFFDSMVASYVARFLFTVGAVAGFNIPADNKALRKFKEREKLAALKASEAEKLLQKEDNWFNKVAGVKDKMIKTRIQWVDLDNLSKLKAPWGFRNSGMGGRHTEKQYPESNISMQEAMFIPLSAGSYEEAQEMTVALQGRLQEIIQKADGCTAKGIGLEGGIAANISREVEDKVPEQRLWRMMTQAIKDLGYAPGKDVALALDPAMSELEIAYREKMELPNAVGLYLFWRDASQVIMTREEVVQLYKDAMMQGIPILSIEDGAAEDDHEGWKLIMKELGDKVFVIGDDSVTTRDSAIENAADSDELNSFLCKANQIGTLTETINALLVAAGKDIHVVVSHRSQSPNDPFEAEIAMAFNCLGLKAGGGANTERLVKYGQIIKTIAAYLNKSYEETHKTQLPDTNLEAEVNEIIGRLMVTDVVAYEDNTNSGNPTVRVDVHIGVPKSKYSNLFVFTGSTPLGTSAGTGEAIHLVDSTISCDNTIVPKYPDFFNKQEDGTFNFKKGVERAQILETKDKALTALFENAERYKGKGCKTAVNNVLVFLKEKFVGMKLTDLTSIKGIDKILLNAELKLSQQRGESRTGDTPARKIEIMQRKGNLGMNAILSMSLAMSRVVANMKGKDLWELIREEACGMMIIAVDRILTKENMRRIASHPKAVDIITHNKPLQDVYGKKGMFTAKDIEHMKFEDLVKLMRIAEFYLKEIRKEHREGYELYSLIREVSGIYSGN